MELASGELTEARRLLEEGLATATGHSDQATEATALFALGVLARAEGDQESATSSHHQALGLRAAIGDAAGVVDSLEAVAGLNVESGRLHLGVRLLGTAHSLRRRRGYTRPAFCREAMEADGQKARASLGGEEFDTAWQEGTTLSVSEAVAYGSRGRGRRLAAAGWESLTTAENRVVGLVAEGLSNPEIAQRLFISARTVQTHLRHVFAKLGVSSRTALAAEVVRRSA
jgi:DNA-binding CsgD family transcriptional regulator